MLSSTQHDGVKREIIHEHLLLNQGHGLLELKVKLPQIFKSVRAKATGRFKCVKSKRGKNALKTYLPKARNVVATLLLLTKVTCTSG